MLSTLPSDQVLPAQWATTKSPTPNQEKKDYTDDNDELIRVDCASGQHEQNRDRQQQLDLVFARILPHGEVGAGNGTRHTLVPEHCLLKVEHSAAVTIRRILVRLRTIQNLAMRVFPYCVRNDLALVIKISLVLGVAD